MYRLPKSFATSSYRSTEEPKPTLQQRGLDGIARMPKSFEGLSDRDAESVRTVTEATNETKADINETLRQ